jgi:hypothetical protein
MSKQTQAEMEAIYDAERSGAIYVKPEPGAEDRAAQPSPLLLAVAEYIDGPAQLQIERHTLNADGEPANDPWTTYAFGEAEIDIHDAGGGNLCIPGLCHNFQDHAPLFDLSLLLSNPTVQQALEHAADDDTYTPCSPVWEAILAITDEEEEDGDEAEMIARENTPVPPVPAGYPLDKAMIYKSYGETFIAIDRRDGEMVICDKGKIAGDEHTVILSPARARALYRFFWNDAMVELMEYHRKKADVLDWEQMKDMPIDKAVDMFGVEALTAAVAAHRHAA